MKVLRIIYLFVFAVSVFQFSESALAKQTWPSFDWSGKHQDSDLWNKHAYDGIDQYGSHLVSTTAGDIAQFCPNYSRLKNADKKLFWIALIAAMSRYESSFNPAASFRESFRDSSGNYVVSRGLLQLSYESARGYGCPIKNGRDLHDAKVNLECTIRILDRWLSRDGVISGKWSGKWRGGARYWSVLRKHSTLSAIKSKTRKNTVCSN